MGALLNRALDKVPVSERGAALGYPFSGELVIQNFVNSINNLKPKAEQVCLAHKADLFQNGQVVGTWKPDSLQKVHQLHKGATKVTWNNPLGGQTLQAGSQAVLTISRCCHPIANANSGNFSQSCPSNEIQQEVSITIN